MYTYYDVENVITGNEDVFTKNYSNPDSNFKMQVPASFVFHNLISLNSVAQP
jgi:hypothetical protein